MLKKKVVVSVIIVVKNDRGIGLTLRKLKKMIVSVPFEVIVVDSSEPSRLEDIRQKNSWVRWVQFPVSNLRTTPAQRNRGLELANGQIIVFLDANCLPHSGWLEAIVSSIKDGQDIVCGPVFDRSKINLVHYAPNFAEGHYVDVCTTISVGIRKKVIDSIGNFDCSFAFGQDIDFFWRARDYGFKIYFDPKIAISHDWGDTNEQLKRAFSYGQARAHLYKKHWKNRKVELWHEPHVWAYSLFIVGLPITYFFPFYPFLLLIPIVKNWSNKPFELIIHHLAYGLGVLFGLVKNFPEYQDQPILNLSR